MWKCHTIQLIIILHHTIMKAFVFSGQGAQFFGMGKYRYDAYPKARALMQRANDILGFSLTDTMFEGSDKDLRHTCVTQPARVKNIG